jgi:hypothetical protein
MTSYIYNAPAGVPGEVTREEASLVLPIMFTSAGTTLVAGDPVFGVNGTASQVIDSTPANLIIGVLTRQAPSIGGDVNSTTPNPVAVQGLITRGFVNVACKVGTPVRNGAVYVRVKAATGKALGDIEATSDGGNNVQMSNWSWAVNGKDANNIAEIELK